MTPSINYQNRNLKLPKWLKKTKTKAKPQAEAKANTLGRFCDLVTRLTISDKMRNINHDIEG